MAPEYGLGRGKVFPAEKATSLLNPLRRLVQSPERTVGRMQLREDAHVLEVGCGPGFFSPSIERAVPNGRLVQLDLQTEMLSVARDRMTSACLVSADAAKLPFASGSFDAVFVSAMLGEVPDREGCLAEIRRALLAAIPHANWLEYMPWLEPIYKDRIELNNDGDAVMPTAPGWGFSFDPAAMTRKRTSS